mmetsp:Transcript_39389/g.47768  ORF Transcript_39389/g.47768 Transcript_39389/m.47768 type:complete len:147 (+) Transcript_39389:290-730(+)|eukprot:CAMPEP_0197862500 /NCGR_PEP_ID=MMETSP1438-20131217/39327_1 /TAXON_ID=1461541 /ORGANISM="Pterosperma sp., Strain CCMP1384" /LENGTH=146 /DNA_ID=CAMNT_0043480081 /DNA_START=211 /DNA_END=651 /DNA_ORIENTATION=+
MAYYRLIRAASAIRQGVQISPNPLRVHRSSSLGTSRYDQPGIDCAVAGSRFISFTGFQHKGPNKLPDDLPGVCVDDMSEEEKAAKRAAFIQRFMESEFGKERAEVMTILGKHQILCRGGREEADRLIDALVEWKANSLADAAVDSE